MPGSNIEPARFVGIAGAMNMGRESAAIAAPWYRVPFFWLLIGVPVSAVALGAIMITLAIRTDDGLVIGGYYQHGQHINQVLARDEVACDRQAQVHLVFDIETGVLSTDLLGNDMAQVDTLTCRLMRPTHSGFDQQLTLCRGPDGRLHGDLVRLTEARWVVQVGTQHRRLVGRINLTQTATLDLPPQAVSSSS